MDVELNAATIPHVHIRSPNYTQNSVLTENFIWFDHNYEVNKLLLRKRIQINKRVSRMLKFATENECMCKYEYDISVYVPFLFRPLPVPVH